MLELRPTCENCNAALPPDSTDAMICAFECTFCRPCVENILHNVCPNCGGGFCSRPIRPKTNWKNGDYLGAYPASTTVVFAACFIVAFRMSPGLEDFGSINSTDGTAHLSPRKFYRVLLQSRFSP